MKELKTALGKIQGRARAGNRDMAPDTAVLLDAMRGVLALIEQAENPLIEINDFSAARSPRPKIETRRLRAVLEGALL